MQIEWEGDLVQSKNLFTNKHKDPGDFSFEISSVARDARPVPIYQLHYFTRLDDTYR